MRYSARPTQREKSDVNTKQANITRDLSHYSAAHYGGKVYKMSEGKWVDQAQFEALKGMGIVRDGKIRVEDEERVTEIDPSLLLFQDASYCSLFDYKSVSGTCTMFAHGVIDFGSHTQSVIATSTMESEVLASHRSTQTLIHTKTLLEELKECKVNEPTLSMEDNKSAKTIMAIPGRRKGAKHFELSLAKTHEFSQNGHVQYVYCSTHEMLADFFTKPLDWKTFQKFRDVIFNVETTGD